MRLSRAEHFCKTIGCDRAVVRNSCNVDGIWQEHGKGVLGWRWDVIIDTLRSVMLGRDFAELGIMGMDRYAAVMIRGSVSCIGASFDICRTPSENCINLQTGICNTISFLHAALDRYYSVSRYSSTNAFVNKCQILFRSDT